MRATKRIVPLITLFFMMTGTGAVFSQEQAGKVFEKALFLEESEGDLEKAIALYEKIVKEHSKEPAIAAKAQFHIGQCYEKLGKAEAIKAYDTVISRFPNETGVVAEAKGRLAVLRRKEPAGLTMTRLIPSEIYMECQTLSPDGTKVAGIVFNNPEAEGQNVAVYDLVTGKLELVTKYDWSKGSRYTYVPIWSPDNRQIALHAGGFETSVRELWISNMAGESRMLFKNPHGGIAPCDWLPDGSAVMAVMENENDTFSMGLISLKEGSFRELYPLQRTYRGRGDMSQAEAGASADASPDGHLIAFSDGPSSGSRDIYLISVDGGSRVSLTDHPADEKQPRWSPDGRHIVFLSNRHGSYALWGIAVRDGRPDGLPFMILEGMQDCELASWTKEGLISRTGVSINDIYTLEIDPQSRVASGNPKILDGLESYGSYVFPTWSPDEQYLFFLSYPRTEKSMEIFLIIMPSKGGKIRKFKFDPSVRSKGGTVRWLPDSSDLGVVCWDSEKRLYFSRLDLDTGEWKSRQIPTGEFSTFSSFAWRADGKAFFYIRTGEDGSEPGVVVHDMETGQERYLLRANRGDSFSWWLKASHDYKRLAFNWNEKIVLVDTDTGYIERPQYNDKQGLFSPAFSPDGKFLVAKGPHDKEGALNELFIISLLDGTIKSLDISGYLPRGTQIVTSPDWSPDGRKIAFDTRTWKSETNLIQNLIPEK
jgi:Tol biopolymer transport system component